VRLPLEQIVKNLIQFVAKTTELYSIALKTVLARGYLYDAVSPLLPGSDTWNLSQNNFSGLLTQTTPTSLLVLYLAVEALGRPWVDHFSSLLHKWASEVLLTPPFLASVGGFTKFSHHMPSPRGWLSQWTSVQTENYPQHQKWSLTKWHAFQKPLWAKTIEEKWPIQCQPRGFYS